VREVDMVALVGRHACSDEGDERVARERGVRADARLDAVLRQCLARTESARSVGNAARSTRGAAARIDSASAWHSARTGVSRCTKRLRVSPRSSVSWSRRTTRRIASTGAGHARKHTRSAIGTHSIQCRYRVRRHARAMARAAPQALRGPATRYRRSARRAARAGGHCAARPYRRRRPCPGDTAARHAV